MGEIIIGGNRITIPRADVHTWHDTKLSFSAPNAPERLLEPHLCVVHWTASERTALDGARKIHATLTARGLSVEFAITNDGAIYQFVDPLERRCRHCSRVNPYSVGIEVSGIGWAGKRGRVARGDTARRRVYTARIHGWSTQWYDFLDAQYEALLGLVDALVAHLPIGPNVMTQPWGRRSDEALQRHNGFCGHLHAAWLGKRNPKCDPGTAPLEKLATHFA